MVYYYLVFHYLFILDHHHWKFELLDILDILVVGTFVRSC